MPTAIDADTGYHGSTRRVHAERGRRRTRAGGASRSRSARSAAKSYSTCTRRRPRGVCASVDRGRVGDVAGAQRLGVGAPHRQHRVPVDGPRRPRCRRSGGGGARRRAGPGSPTGCAAPRPRRRCRHAGLHEPAWSQPAARSDPHPARSGNGPHGVSGQRHTCTTNVGGFTGWRPAGARPRGRSMRSSYIGLEHLGAGEHQRLGVERRHGRGVREQLVDRRGADQHQRSPERAASPRGRTAACSRAPAPAGPPRAAFSRKLMPVDADRLPALERGRR